MNSLKNIAEAMHDYNELSWLKLHCTPPERNEIELQLKACVETIDRAGSGRET